MSQEYYVFLFLLWLSIVLYRADLLFKAGRTGFGLRLYEFSAAQLEEAVRNNPFEGSYVVHLGLARLNAWAGDPKPETYQTARSTFQYGQGIDPFNADNYYIESRMILMSERGGVGLGVAEDLAKKSLQIDPYYAEAFLNLAIIAEMRKDSALAAHYFEEALLINPRFDDAYLGLQGLYRGKDQQGRYRASLSRVEEKYRDWPEIHVRFAESYHVSGDIRRAVQFYEKVLSHDPKNLQALVGVATLWVAQGDLTRAEQIFHDVLEEDPLRVEALNGMGWILEKRGDPQKAREYYRQALTVDPYNVFAKQRVK